MEIKLYFGAASIIIGLICFIPYVYWTLQKKIRPHAISFLIWTLTLGTVAAAQFVSEGGSGMWWTALSAFMCFTTALLALFYHGSRQIFWFEWGCLIVAILALILWGITENPLYSVLIICGVDFIGSIPTFRKTYQHPNEESALMFGLGVIAFSCGIVALSVYSLINMVYPLTLIFSNLVIIGIIFFRKR